MKVVSAVDSFKGSLTSLEVSEAIETGAKKVNKAIIVKKIALADGGEGTVQSFIQNSGGEFVKIQAKDPLGREITASYGILGDGKTAVIETAEASGLPLLKEFEKNPMEASTYGTGELIKHAIQNGCREFIIGLGGSATNDGGMGMLAALGFQFLDENGNILVPAGKSLEKVCEINMENVMEELNECKFLVACDVDNPFYGKNGAAYVYAKQKGADDEMIKELDKGLKIFSGAIEKAVGKSIANISGAGAAGGMGGAFLGFLNSELRPGIDIVIEKIKLEDIIKSADVVITGEGRIDFQTAMGKAPIGVAKLAQKYNIPVIAIGGSVADNIENIYEKGIKAVFSVMDSPMSLAEAMDNRNAKRLVAKTAEQIFRTIELALSLSVKEKN